MIDAMSRLKSLGRYANDARGITKVKGITNNSRYVQEKDKRVFIEAVKNIPANSEILVPYGREYWQVIRDNKKILEREKKTKKL